MNDDPDKEPELLDVIEEDKEVIDETLYEDFAVSELDTDMIDEGLKVVEMETEAVVVDVGVSFDVKLPSAVIEGIKVGFIDDDPLTDDELDG